MYSSITITKGVAMGGKRGNCPPPPERSVKQQFFPKKCKIFLSAAGASPRIPMSWCQYVQFSQIWPKKRFSNVFLTLLKILIFFKFLPLPKFWSGYVHTHNSTFFILSCSS